MPFRRCASVCEHRVLRCCDINYFDASGRETHKTLLIKLGLQFSDEKKKMHCLSLFVQLNKSQGLSAFTRVSSKQMHTVGHFFFHLGKLHCCVM